MPSCHRGYRLGRLSYAGSDRWQPGDEIVFREVRRGNFQEPLRRTAEGIDTYDQELDIVVAPDGAWRFKDDELMEPWIERGRFSVEEVAAIRAEGARLPPRLDAGERWWDESWSTWRPDPGWTVP